MLHAARISSQFAGYGVMKPNTIYNSAGYLIPNPREAYSVSTLTAKKGADGLVMIQFGERDGKVANCLPITPGWNYTVRMYFPRQKSSMGNGSSP